MPCPTAARSPWGHSPPPPPDGYAGWPGFQSPSCRRVRPSSGPGLCSISTASASRRAPSSRSRSTTPTTDDDLTNLGTGKENLLWPLVAPCIAGLDGIARKIREHAVDAEAEKLTVFG